MQECVYNLRFSPDGKTLVCSAYDFAREGTIRVYDYTAGKELRRFPGARYGTVFGLAPDGKVLLTSDRDKAIHVLDLATGEELWKWQGLGFGYVYGYRQAKMAFAADGRTVFCLCEDYKVRVWEVATAKLEQVFPAHHFDEDLANNIGRSLSCAFSPNAALVAFGGRLKYIALHDMKTGKEVKRLSDPQLTDGTANLAFSHDGRTLASCDQYGGTVHLWEIATGQQYRQFVGHRGRILDLAFSADCSLLVTGNEDTTALVWDLTGTAQRSPIATADRKGTSNSLDQSSQRACHDKRKRRCGHWCVRRNKPWRFLASNCSRRQSLTPNGLPNSSRSLAANSTKPERKR